MKVVRSDRTVALGERKIQDLTRKFTKVVSVALTESQLAESIDVCDNYIELVYSINEKLRESDQGRKIQLITLVPEN